MFGTDNVSAMELYNDLLPDPLPTEPMALASAWLATARASRQQPNPDAMVLATHVPAAMLFVPSRAGVSHSPEEYTTPEHCELGARVLTRAVSSLVANHS